MADLSHAGLAGLLQLTVGRIEGLEERGDDLLSGLREVVTRRQGICTRTEEVRTKFTARRRFVVTVTATLTERGDTEGHQGGQTLVTGQLHQGSIFSLAQI